MKQDIKWTEDHDVAWDYLVARDILIKKELLEEGRFPINLTRDTHIHTANLICDAMVEFRMEGLEDIQDFLKKVKSLDK